MVESYRLSNYQLSSKEIAQSFFVSTYARRHWEAAKHDASRKWGHRLIAIIEFIPVLGALATLIEGIVAAIFNAAKKKNIQKPLPPITQPVQPRVVPKPVPGPHQKVLRPAPAAPQPIEAKRFPDEEFARLRREQDQWKYDFKEALLKAHEAGPPKRIPKQEIKELVELKADQILAVFKDLRKHFKTTIPGVHFFLSAAFVFKMDEIPGLVFKMQRRESFEKYVPFLKRRQNMDLAQEAAKELPHLRVPHYGYFDQLNGEAVELFVEEELPLQKASFSNQEELFAFCANDKDLLPIFEAYLKELVTFICKTGFNDVKWDNIPLLADGSGFGLVDLEHMQNVPDGIIGLINCLQLQNFMPLEDAVKKIDRALYDQIYWARHENNRVDQLQSHKAFEDYLLKKQIVTGREPIQVVPLALAALPEIDRRMVQLMLKVIQKELDRPESVSLRDRRTVFVGYNSYFLNKDTQVQEEFRELREKAGNDHAELIRKALQFLQDQKLIFKTYLNSYKDPMVLC